ncbi:MAG: hypothetical protein AAB676_10585 [Verrucomicrobiota bacterium]
MIQLHRDYLVIETSSGQAIPCSAEMITVELMGEYASLLDPEIVQQSAAAVLHYFKHELAQEFVSVSEFSAALAKALKSFGLTVEPAEPPPAPSRVLRSDLRKLALVADKGSELFFFPLLRKELRTRLHESPKVLRFHGLRGCVKQLTGARRWSNRCQELSDRIVEYLRQCLKTEPGVASCGLVVE